MASEEWAGFTDEDIRRMKSNLLTQSDAQNTSRANKFRGEQTLIQPRKPMKLKGINKHPQQRLPAMFDTISTRNDVTNELTPLTKSGDVVLSNETNCQTTTQGCHGNVTVLKVDKESHTYRILENEENHSEHVANSNLKQDNSAISEVKNMSAQREEFSSDTTVKSPSLSSHVSVLEMFEQRQKKMEEENARCKALLIKAILDRKKRTHAESQKLAKIQEELNHLDSLLSVDVSILRNQIELASMEFSEAQKRYLKAEKEFVEAKMLLFQKMERKERLTEHLCAIIEHSEDRKAQKLAELMQQLEMESLVKECQSNGMGSILPQLCALNDVTYRCCTTIKPPESPKEEVENSKVQTNSTNVVLEEQKNEIKVEVDTQSNLNSSIDDKNTAALHIHSEECEMSQECKVGE